MAEADDEPTIHVGGEESTFEPPEGGVLSRYTVLEELGRGGMGVVYRAFDRVLSRVVAIKKLHGGTDRRDKLEREARAMAQLKHANVVSVYDVAQLGQSALVVMEYVPGGTLSQWLVEESRSDGEIIDHYLGAARGLQAAHEAGLVHRDFKPSNVLLDGDSTPKVTDFGLATEMRALPAGEARDASVLRLDGSTAEGIVLGTPRYMAPEQHEGAPATSRSDQFAFCVALATALKRGAIFEGEDLDQLYQNKAYGRAQLPTTVSRRVTAVLRRGLAPSPDDRFGSMAALIESLRPDRSRVRRAMAIGGAAMTVLSLSYLVWNLSRPATIEVEAFGESGEALQDLRLNVDGRRHTLSSGRAQVRPGRRLIEVTAPTHESFRDVVELESGRTQAIRVDLEHHKGALSLEVFPTGARSFLDGVDVGSRLVAHRVDTGEHTLRAEARGHYSRDSSISIAHGDVETAYLSLPSAMRYEWPGNANFGLLAFPVGDLNGDGHQELLEERVGKVLLHDVVAGRPIDDLRLGNDYGGSLSPAGTPEQRLFVRTFDGSSDILGELGLVKLTAAGFEERWTVDLLASHAEHRPVWVEGEQGPRVLSAAVRPAELTMLEGETGKTLRSWPLSGAVRYLGPRRSEPGVWVLTPDELMGVDLDSAGVPVRHRFERPCSTTDAVRRSPSSGLEVFELPNDSLVVQCADRLIGLQPSEAESLVELWSHPGAVFVGPQQDTHAVRGWFGTSDEPRIVTVAGERLSVLDAAGGVEWSLPVRPVAYDTQSSRGREGAAPVLTGDPDDPLLIHLGPEQHTVWVRRARDGRPLASVALDSTAGSGAARLYRAPDDSLRLALVVSDPAMNLYALPGGQPVGRVPLPKGHHALTGPFDFEGDGLVEFVSEGAGPMVLESTRERWRRRSRSTIRAAPSVVSGREGLRLVVSADFDRQGLWVLDAASGEVLSRPKANYDVIRPLTPVTLGDGTALAGQGSRGGFVFDPDTGTYEDLSAPRGYGTPLVFDDPAAGQVALPLPWDDDSNARAIALDGGEVLWSSPIERGGWARSVIIADDGPLFVFGDHDGRLHALEAGSGRRRWSVDVQQTSLAWGPAVEARTDASVLWIGDTDSGDLVSISSSGEVLERLSVGVDGPVAVAEGNVVLGHSRDGLVALRGGETLWTRAGEFAKVDFVVADLDSDGEPELMVLTQDGWLEVLDVESGTVLGRLQHGRRGFEAAPVAFDLDDDGLLEVVLGSRDGFLAAYDGATLSR